MSIQDSLHYLLIWDMLDGYGVELLTSDPSSLTPPLYNVFLLSLAVNVMSRCSHKSQVHENWSSTHNIFRLRNMKWVLCQNFRHIIKTKLVRKLLARLCCLLLRRGSEELLHLLGCCRNLAFDRWLEHGFRGPDSTWVEGWEELKLHVRCLRSAGDHLLEKDGNQPTCFCFDLTTLFA